MKKINLLVLAVVIGLTFNSYSQKENSKIIRPFHLSFITPMGTNGMESDKVTNNFSFNIFAGYSGGLNGFELAGFANIIKGETKGFQLAGFSNTNKSSVVGCQISGFSNVCLGSAKGFQLAGFSNTNKSNVQGCQISGFSNVCIGSAIGLQIAGFANVVKDSIKALQISGFCNVAKKMTKGGQISGFANVNRGSANGLQITGFANVSNGNSKALQIAGFSNVNEGDFTGLQISGFLNRVKKLNGAQIGFINISDTIENGIALGFLSIVKKGYRTVEISGNETFYCVANFKTGTERFYNIISVGAKLYKNDIVWGWGYGLGTMFLVHEKVKMNLDITSYHVNYDEWFTNRLNLLNKVNLTVNYKLNDYITIFGGPTWNIHVSDIYDDEGVPVTSSLVSWSSYNKIHNNTNVKMYPGFTLGIRL